MFGALTLLWLLFLLNKRHFSPIYHFSSLLPAQLMEQTIILLNNVPVFKSTSHPLTLLNNKHSCCIIRAAFLSLRWHPSTDWGPDNWILMITWECLSVYANLLPSLLSAAFGEDSAVTKHTWKVRVNHVCSKAFLAKEVNSHRNSAICVWCRELLQPAIWKEWGLSSDTFDYSFIYFSRLLSFIITVAPAFRGCCGGCSHGEDDPFFTGCTANTIKGRASHLFMNIHLIHINALCHEYLSLSWIAAVVYW